MTLTLDRLRALKRQAGGSDATPAAPVPRRAGSVAGAAWPVEGAAAAVSRTRLHGDDACSTPATQDTVETPHAPALAEVASDAAPAHASIDSAQSASGNVAALRRLLGLRERALPRAPARALDRHLPGTEIADGLWLIESRVADAPPPAPLPLAFARREGHVDAAHLVFFDTETTGLAGGTGTRAFMIGAADWFDGALRIRQLLIANMAAERAMLREFASWLAPSTVLASYNGRSYDAPLLRTRYRLARLADALHGLDHLDLLHPARRRWRGRWENCRLATIEREALRILREDDLPGAQAPAAWLGYLRGGDAVNLRRVAEHNRQDVATLARLLVRLSTDEAHGR